jgi:thiamine pyrophosphate-dependent acetolactate synthase large subunit-like protein
MVAKLLEQRGDALVVCGLGSPVWDVTAAGDRPDNLYLWGAMGQAVPVGLGLALAQPERRVAVLTGDGEILMGLGSLAVVGAQRPANLGVLVLDNEAFSETGRQPGLTGAGVDVAAIAKAAGWGATTTMRDLADLDGVAELLFRAPGPTLAVAKVALDDEPLVLPPKHGPEITTRFRHAVLGDKAG